MFLAKSYCDIGNSRSSSSIVAPDGEITTTFEYDDHIGASIKDLGKKWFCLLYTSDAADDDYTV